MSAETTTTPSVEEQRARLAREIEQTEIASLRPGWFSTYDVNYLLDYKRNVLRWSACAPEGALVLAAPLQGRDGTPMGDRSPMGPADTPGPRTRELLAKVGRDWQLEAREKGRIRARVEELQAEASARGEVRTWSDAHRQAAAEILGPDYFKRSEAYFAEQRAKRESAKAGA
jgi:hypothetical protein